MDGENEQPDQQQVPAEQMVPSAEDATAEELKKEEAFLEAQAATLAEVKRRRKE